MKVENFKAVYARTLHIDTQSQETFIKIPIANLDELGYLHQALINELHWISLTADQKREPGELCNSLHWLTKILQCSYPQDELEGLTALLETGGNI